MKAYPWKSLETEGKYGLFTDIESHNYGIIWPFQENIFDDPYKVGKRFGEFIISDVLERFPEISIDPERDLPTEGKEGIIIYFVDSGKIESLNEGEFESFKKGLKKGYPAIND